MSAVPKKKLCWHCDGSIATETYNCPYCGVYLHATEDSENRWSPKNYESEDKDETAPTPLYKLKEEEISDTNAAKEAISTPILSPELIQKLILDVGPIFMLMCGSIFFLFGVILYLFAQDGLLTLQWNATNWVYFLGFSLPLLITGYYLLQQIDPSDS